MSNFEDESYREKEEREEMPAKRKRSEIFPVPKPVKDAADEETVEITIDEEEEKVDNVIKLSKKYKFEGKVIDEIDLSALEDVSGEQMQSVEKLYRRITKTPTSTPEITLDYAMAMAATLTDLPIEFFKKISGRDIVKIKNRVVNFLYAD